MDANKAKVMSDIVRSDYETSRKFTKLKTKVSRSIERAARKGLCEVTIPLPLSTERWQADMLLRHFQAQEFAGELGFDPSMHLSVTWHADS
jgi:hypothetical protein